MRSMDHLIVTFADGTMRALALTRQAIRNRINEVLHNELSQRNDHPRPDPP